MKFVRAINRLLAPANIALTKRSTLERLCAESASLQAGPAHAVSSEVSTSISATRELIRHQIAQKWSLVDVMERELAGRHATRQCPLCGHEGDQAAFGQLTSHCIFGGGHLIRHSCPDCSLVFGPDKMLSLTEHELSQDYEWHYKVYDEADSTLVELQAFYALKPVKDGVYLNYGAGAWSSSVPQLRAEGWNVFAYEPHAAASGETDYVINDHTQLQQMRFDGIFSNNVLEHLRWPVRELAAMAALLKADGRMSHVTPCYDYLFEFTRFHLFFYVGSSRYLLIDKAGLEEISYSEVGNFKCSVMRLKD
jgi:hypothetical protein